MKKNNKPLSFVLALMMCLCLAGCGEESDDAPESTPASSVTANSTPASPNNSEPAVSNTAEITFDPVVSEVLDIEGNHLTGFGFNKRTVYGNAFSIIESYGSSNGNIIENTPISIIPIGMTDLDEILATEYCYFINKENLVETDFGGGTTGWMYNQEAAEKQAKNCGDYTFVELYEEMKIIELTGSGLSQQDAIAQVKIKIADVGLYNEY